MSELTSVPPRALTIPAQPTPLTNCGILSDFGVPSDNQNITDIAPDFSWMTALEIFKGSFRVGTDDTLNKKIYQIYPASKVDPQDSTILTPLRSINADWHFLPFLTSRWWNGNVKLRFIAIKPPRVTGKLLFRWFPDASVPVNISDQDTLARSIKYEWDLGLSNEFSIDISGYNVACLRPTWIPKKTGSWGDQSKSYGSWAGMALPPMQCTYGRLDVSLANSIQPGSLFPDSIRILIFQSFPGASLHTSTDIRGTEGDYRLNHFFNAPKPSVIFDNGQ